MSTQVSIDEYIQAAKEYAKSVGGKINDYDMLPQYQGFKAGAEWQKQQSNTPTIQLEEGEFDEDELIRLADEWVFITNGNKWSNNNNEAGDNYGSFKAGYKAAYQQRSSDEVINLLTEAKLQIEYLHGKFKETGTGNAVIEKIKQYLLSIK